MPLKLPQQRELNNSSFIYPGGSDVDDDDELLEVSYLYDNEDILAIYDAKGRVSSSFIH